MTNIDPKNPQHAEIQRTWIRKSLRWFGTSVLNAVLLMLVAWGSLAIYFSNLPWSWVRTVLCRSVRRVCGVGAVGYTATDDA